MFKVAIVGCGAIAGVHAASLQNMDNVTVIGCADIKIERAEKLAAKFGCPAYTSLDEMLAAQKPDVLHICTPHYLHVPMALKAAQMGIAVLSEKPEGISLEQLDELAKAEEAGATIGICFQNRYNEAVEAACEHIESGVAGKIKGIRAFVTWNRQAPYYTNSGWRGTWETEGGGVMINQAIHTLDLIQYFGGYPTHLEGKIQNHHLKDVIEVEDTASIYMRLPGGIPAVMYATTAFAVDSPVLIDIVCENMTLRLEGNTLKETKPDGSASTPVRSAEYGKENPDGKCYWGSGHPSLFYDFYKHLEEGKPFPLNAKEGAKAVKLLLALYESSKEEKVIEL